MNEIQIIQGMTPELAAKRATCVGASEVPALFGVHPYLTTLQLWGRKTGRLPEQEENRAMRLGTLLEPIIAMEYRKETNRHVERMGIRHHRHESVPLGCTPDYGIAPIAESSHIGAGSLQLKSVNAYKGHEWADGIPLWVQMQVQAELACLGYQWGSAAALIGGQDFRWGDVERHEAFIVNIYEHVAEFWFYVEKDRQPPEISADDRETLRELYPNEVVGKVIQLDGAAAALTDEIEEWEREKKRSEEEIDRRKADIEAILGDAEEGILPDGRKWTWKTMARKGYVVEPSHSRQLRKTKGRSNVRDRESTGLLESLADDVRAEIDAS